jgi:hypothetical protein
VLHAKALRGNPFDGHTLGPVVAELDSLTGVEPRRIHVDKGYAATSIVVGPDALGFQVHASLKGPKSHSISCQTLARHIAISRFSGSSLVQTLRV